MTTTHFDFGVSYIL